MATGGSIESVSCAGRVFPVPADADIQRKLGGYENELQMNGDGSGRVIRTRVPASLTGLVVAIDDTRGDQEFLEALKDARDYFPFSVTYASGATYAGQLQIVGELQAGSQGTTATMDLQGPNKLQRI